MNTTTQIKFTRQDYLADKCTHSEYYGQFVTGEIKQRVMSYIGIENIKKAINEGDEHLNTIPLRKWDAIAVPIIGGNLLREAGDYPTLAGGVCIAKEAAKQLANNNNY
jgi:hypothetical protein